MLIWGPDGQWGEMDGRMNVRTDRWTNVIITISATKMADFSTSLSTGFDLKILGTILKFMHCRNIVKLSFI